uniref:Secreted protein n=1 Tax=Anguilla anguilla TaxID=7936 RepID=A0A0E9V248_ANGAN
MYACLCVFYLSVCLCTCVFVSFLHVRQPGSNPGFLESKPCHLSHLPSVHFTHLALKMALNTLFKHFKPHQDQIAKTGGAYPGWE